MVVNRPQIFERIHDLLLYRWIANCSRMATRRFKSNIRLTEGLGQPLPVGVGH